MLCPFAMIVTADAAEWAAGATVTRIQRNPGFAMVNPSCGRPMMLTPENNDQFVVCEALPKSAAWSPSAFDTSIVNRDGPSDPDELHDNATVTKSLMSHGLLVDVDPEPISAVRPL